MLLPAVAAGPGEAVRLHRPPRPHAGRRRRGPRSGLSEDFAERPPDRVLGDRVSHGAEVLQNDGGAKLRREATLMGVLAEAASDHRELGLFVALSGY